MDKDKADYAGHHREMDDAGKIEAAKQTGDELKLYRLPDRQPGNDNTDAA